MASPGEEIMKDMGLEDLSPKAKEEILGKMMDALFKRIALRVITKLPEDSLAEFEKLQKKGDPAELHKFLSGKIPGYEQIVADVAAEFKREMQEAARAVQ